MSYESLADGGFEVQVVSSSWMKVPASYTISTPSPDSIIMKVVANAVRAEKVPPGWKKYSIKFWQVTEQWKTSICCGMYKVKSKAIPSVHLAMQQHGRVASAIRHFRHESQDYIKHPVRTKVNYYNYCHNLASAAI